MDTGAGDPRRREDIGPWKVATIVELPQWETLEWFAEAHNLAADDGKRAHTETGETKFTMIIFGV